MKLVIVEDRLDRVARIVSGLLDKIEKIIIYQSKQDFENSSQKYAGTAFWGKVQRVDAWDMYDVLSGLYEAVDAEGNPRNILLFDLCLEDERVAFEEKLSVSYIRLIEPAPVEQPRCFVYTTFDRMQQELDQEFGTRVIHTDLSQNNFLLYQNNTFLCEALAINAEGEQDDA